MQSSSRRLRVIVGLVTLFVFLALLFSYFSWRQRHLRDTYPALVSAFYEGVVALEVGDDEHALSSLTLATQIAPQEPAAWADLGLYMLRRNSLDQAREYLQKAHDLAPGNERIIGLLGLLETQQGNFPQAVADWQQAVGLAPSDLQARYALAQAIQQQAGPGSDAQAEEQIAAVFQAAPNNLFADFEMAATAAKAGRSELLQSAVRRIAAQKSAFPPDAKADFTTVQALAAGADTHGVVVPLTGLQNEIKPLPQYQKDAELIQGPQSVLGVPLDRFVTLPSPSPTPAPPDSSLHFIAQPLPVPGASTVWNWAGSLTPAPDAAPVLLTANGREVRLPHKTLPFPGGTDAVAPGPDSVLALDWNNDFALDIALAGQGGLRLFQQSPNGTYADVTAKAKLPPAVLNGAYTGVWTADFDTDGDLDLILGTPTGQPTLLRNNGDGKWSVQHPFAGLAAGLQQFVWVDLDGDGLPDAAFLDNQGRLNALENKRSGLFQAWEPPPGLGRIVALSAGVDTEQENAFDLVAMSADGAIRRLARRPDGIGWIVDTIAHAPPFVAAGINPRLRWADLDNNGALDLIATGAGGSQIWLADAGQHLVPLGGPLSARNLTVDAQAANGRVSLTGLSDAGQPVQLVSQGLKKYAWQEVRLRAQPAGDRRNNTYGIGGEIALRAGLLYERQPVTQSVTHFGLGTAPKADAIRILWPNGVPQAEFALKADQLAEAPERLKGSCPWVFADNGQGMQFVTDFIWRSPLGLRINAQNTAGVVQTRDWVKIRGDQLAPRDGFYRLSITADLWETHFFDYAALMTLDHPVGTEVFVDERFAIPPPPLAAEAMTPPQPVARAVDERGKDVTDLVRAHDGRYLDTFGRGDYQGVTRDHWVTLDLPPPPPAGKPFWLVASGWIHPTDSSLNVALSEGHHAPPVGLRLEAPDGKGGWVTARPALGFPEGKNKTILINLSGLIHPGLPRKVRLRTNMEIFWDFLGTATGLPRTPFHTHLLAPTLASLSYRGFSATRQAGWSSPEVPDYAALAGQNPRWLDLEGYYTRYGDVRPLLNRVDDRYVIMNAGDELTLRFPAPAPPPAGWTRDYVLIGDGWVKDGDFNTGFSRTVLPLPSHDQPNYNLPPGRLEDDPVYRRHRQDWKTYQTRYVTPRLFQQALRPR